VVAVLYLDPVLRAASLIRPVTALRHQALKAHVAGGAEQVRADLAALERVDEDALGPAREQALKAGFAKVQWQLAQVVVALDQDVEGAELDLIVVLARMQGVEVGDTVDVEDDGLSVEHEPLARGLGDPGVALGPVIAAPEAG
jgi:hypothetical protein